MQYFKFLIQESILFGLIIIVNYFYDINLGPPFTKTDVIASIICLSILGYLLFLLFTLFKRFDNIVLKNTIILSIPNFIITALVIGIIFSSIGIK